MTTGGRCATLRAATLAAALAFTGCARIEVHYPDGRTASMSKAEFKAYVREVFRRQNHATDRLIARLDGGSGDAALEAAEDAMQAACAPLIDLVQAKVDRRRLPLAEKLEMPHVAPACEAAVAKVEVLLPSP